MSNITGRCGGWLADVDGSRLGAGDGFIPSSSPARTAVHQRALASASATNGPVSGAAAVIIDWHRRRSADQTIEENVRLAAFTRAASKRDLIQPPKIRMVIEKYSKTYSRSDISLPSPTSFQISRREMTETAAYTNSAGNTNSTKRTRNRDAIKHVTFSEPEVSHILITREESIPIMDYINSPVASAEKPLIIRRYYFVERNIIDELRRAKTCCCLDTKENWSEFYYDTPGSSLSSLECVLMKDSKAPKYWRFFSFAEDNIMEITTDEQEINEPLSRLMSPDSQNGPSNATRKESVDNRSRAIDGESLKTFFVICYETDSFLTTNDGTYFKVTFTDYGFAWVTVERMCVNGERLADLTLEMESLAKRMGFSSLASYDPLRYL